MESNKCRSSTSGTNNPLPPLTTPSGPAPSCRLARGISHTSAGGCTDLRGNAVSTQDLHRSGTQIYFLVLNCLYWAAPIRSVNGGLKWNCFGALNIRCCNLQTSSMSRVNSRAVSQTLHFPIPQEFQGPINQAHALQIRAVEAKPPLYPQA